MYVLISLLVYVQSATTNDDESRIYDKKSVCYYCEIEYLKIGRHLQCVHKDCPEVMKALSFPAKSTDRRKELDRIRLMGNFVHNNKVLVANEGELHVVRRPNEGTKANPFDYYPCLYCNGFLDKKELYKHVANCTFADGQKEIHPRRVRFNCSLLLAPNKLSLGSSKALSDHVLPRMKTDQYSLAARNDQIILLYGSSLVEKHGKDKANYVSQHMRDLSRLLVEGRNLLKMPSLSMKDIIAPDKFDILVQATKNASGFQDDIDNHLGQYKSPSTALKLGYALKKAAYIVRGQAIRSRDLSVQKDVDDFLKLHEQEWADKISVKALNSLAFRKHNKPECLPLTEDLLKLRKFQLEKMEELHQRLQIFPNTEIWRELATICLSRMIVFNKRRSGEAARLRIDVFNSRPDWNKNQNEEITSSLSPQEKELCKR